MKNVTMKKTTLGNSYWTDSGAYNNLQKMCFDNLVPGEGEADTTHGEALRCANRVYYEFFNNGNCNAKDYNYIDNGFEYGFDDDDYYEMEEEYEVVVNPGFLEMLQTIAGIVGTGEIDFIKDQIIDIMLDESRVDRFSDANTNVYDSLIDHVMFHILTTDNKPYSA